MELLKIIPKPNILIVDDERELANTFRRFLINENYDVMVAGSYCEAEELLSKNDFDLVFTDIKLGDKSGIDVLKRVKMLNNNCPVVMVTGFPLVDTACEAVRIGAYDYIYKPLQKDKLLAISRQAIQQKIIDDNKLKIISSQNALINNCKYGVITLDNSFSIINANTIAEKICGFSFNVVKGGSIDSLQIPCSLGCIKIMNKALIDNESCEINKFDCKKNNGSKQLIKLQVFPLFDENKLLFACALVTKEDTPEFKPGINETEGFYNIIGKTEEMKSVYNMIEKLANINTTILITGESGTGKELIADALHNIGDYKKRPLVKFNCSAVPEELIESEIFGHVRGSFTGAFKDRMGRFEIADGGTIFLDEIGDISNKMQLRLLRVLQEKEVERVGDSTPIKIDVRVITATNQNLLEKVKRGQFREDLYHRLAVIELDVPPLRKRKSDIPLLIKFFIEKFHNRFNKSVKDVSLEVQKLFMDYEWPGNVRELEHTIEHAFVLCNSDIINIKDLPSLIKNTRPDLQLNQDGMAMDEPEKLITALEKTNWNKSKAAKLLGIDRKTLYRKLWKYNI